MEQSDAKEIIKLLRLNLAASLTNIFFSQAKHIKSKAQEDINKEVKEEMLYALEVFHEIDKLLKEGHEDQ